MSNVAFSTLSANAIAQQPTSASAIIVRSSSASDTANLTIYGTISATPDSEVVALLGKREVSFTGPFSALSQILSASTAVGAITGFMPGTAAVGDCRCDTNPADGDTLSVYLTGTTITYRFKNTLATAYDVKIEATAADTALNLKKAINADGIAGTDYGNSTVANPFVSAAIDGTVVTVTDRLACNRQLAWVFTESAANFSIRSIIGGANGVTLFTIPAGYDYCYNTLTFSTEDHATETLPALMLGTSQTVSIGGGSATVRTWADNAIDIKFQSSTDGTNWHDTSEGTISLTPSTLQYTTLAQPVEYLRMVIVTNSNTDDTILDARVIY